MYTLLYVLKNYEYCLLQMAPTAIPLNFKKMHQRKSFFF